MAGSVNKVILVGNLGQDPEIRSFQNGGRVANLSVATSESWKDKQTGERKERTQWHRVVVMNEGLIGLCEKYITKGMKIYIEGQLETRKYTDKDGSEKYTTEVVLRPFNGSITMLSGGKDSGESKSNNDSYSQDTTSGFSSMPNQGIDDEIPF